MQLRRFFKTFVALIHKNIGSVYGQLNNYEKALKHYLCALGIIENVLNPNYLYIGYFHYNIGLVYVKLCNYEEALKHYHRSLENIEIFSPSDLLSISEIHNNIGWVYRRLKNYKEALKHYLCALENRENVLPPNYLIIAKLHDNIGLVCGDLCKYEDALIHYCHELEIRYNVLPIDHLDIAVIHNNIGWVYRRLENYEETLKHYLLALENREKYLPLDHSYIASLHKNIGWAYMQLDNYKDALEHYHNALKIRENILPIDHLDIVAIHNNIGWVYRRLKNYKEALKHYLCALEIRENVLPRNHSYIASLHNNIGWAYRQLDNYKDALEHYHNALKIRENILPIDHLDIAAIHNNIGWIYRRLDNYEDALKHYLCSLKIFKKNFSPNHLDIATAHNNIGLSYEHLINNTEALKHFSCALEIYEKSFPDKHSDIAKLHKNLGSIFDKIFNYEEALKHYVCALECYRKFFPDNHRDIATAYNDIGVVYGHLTNYDDALVYHIRALDIWKSIAPPEYLNIAATYNIIGLTYNCLNNYDEASKHYASASEIMMKILPPEYHDIDTKHDYITMSHDNKKNKDITELIMYKDAMTQSVIRGDIENALKYAKCALQFQQKVFSAKNLDIAKSYLYIGTIYRILGNYEESLTHYLRALEIRKNMLPSVHLDIATSYNHIGLAYHLLGNYEDALTYHINALEIREKALPPSQQGIATSNTNIGSAYRELGNYEKALTYHVHALEILKNILPFNHPKIATSLSNIGLSHEDLGNYEKALNHFENALEIFKTGFPPELFLISRTYTALTYMNIGSVYSRLNNDNEAIKYYTYALDIKEKELLLSPQDSAWLYKYLCQIYYQQNNMKEAIKYANKLIDYLSHIYTNIMQVFSETLRKKQLQSIRTLIYFIHNVAILNPNNIDKNERYDLLLKSKDINAEAERVIRAYKNPERYPEYEDRLNQLKDKQNYYQHLLLYEPEKKDKIEKLKSEIQKLELPLVSEVPEINFKYHMADMNTGKVLENLSDGYALLEYGWFHFTKSNVDTMADIESGGRYYAYFLRDGEITPYYFEEGEEVIHAKLYEVRKKITERENNRYIPPSDVSTELSELYKILIFPFEDKLVGIKHLYIAPDGELYKLPFELLLDNSGKTLASDAITVSYLSSGRDLVRLAGRKHIKGYTSMAILADPKFELPEGYETTGDDDASRKQGILPRQSHELGNLKGFEPIPYTKVEADAIDRVFTESKIKKYGLEAKKNTLSKIGSRNIVHIATHGFALEKQELPEHKIKMSLQSDLPHSRVADPLMRCGLAFAGAHTFLKSDRKELMGEYDDGILTAKDVLSLDLPETDLLVLSACQTALGEVRNGEGIQGMRRAFELAGVRTIICTLWSVPDASSAILMEEFYARLLKNKDMNKLRALAEAKEHVKTMKNGELIKYLINNNITDATEKTELEDIYSNATDDWKEERPYEHPYYWAGYILQGDIGCSQA